jgi:hypothetical protein
MVDATISRVRMRGLAHPGRAPEVAIPWHQPSSGVVASI